MYTGGPEQDSDQSMAFSFWRWVTASGSPTLLRRDVDRTREIRVHVQVLGSDPSRYSRPSVYLIPPTSADTLTIMALLIFKTLARRWKPKLGDAAGRSVSPDGPVRFPVCRS